MTAKIFFMCDSNRGHFQAACAFALPGTSIKCYSGEHKKMSLIGRSLNHAIKDNA